MLLIDATLPSMAALGKKPDHILAKKWIKTLEALGCRAKSVSEPIIVPEAVYGLDRVFWGNYSLIFKRLRQLGPTEVVFGNSGGLATAMAACWLEEGGSGLVCSLGGVGGLPVWEQLRLMLHLTGRLLLPKTKASFQRIRELSADLGSQQTDLFQPILGQGIFAGESGVHVDSWGKDPGLYEPFGPELVDSQRFLIVGRHSGQGALRLKCRELGLKADNDKLLALLGQVRRRALELERALTDREFLSLFKNCQEI
jgi:isopropylmalate/homocitrate/citramalate synthase